MAVNNVKKVPLGENIDYWKPPLYPPPPPPPPPKSHVLDLRNRTCRAVTCNTVTVKYD